MRLRRKQTAHLQHRQIVEVARREKLPNLVAYCGKVVDVDTLDSAAIIRVCAACSRVASEIEADRRRGGAA